jgi:hypothetical protein
LEEENVMKTMRITLAALALAIGANTLTAAPASTGWADQWFRAKFGHSSPQEAARQKAELENTAFREEATTEAAQSPLTWTEQYFRAKFGRSSPVEDALRKAELENTAFREETTAGATPSSRNWTEQYFKAKWGRDVRNGR